MSSSVATDPVSGNTSLVLPICQRSLRGAIAPTARLPIKRTFISFDELPSSPLTLARTVTCPPSWTFVPEAEKDVVDGWLTDASTDCEVTSCLDKPGIPDAY